MHVVLQANSAVVSGHNKSMEICLLRHTCAIMHAQILNTVHSFFIFLASAGYQIGTAEPCLVQVPKISNDVIESLCVDLNVVRSFDQVRAF